MTMYLYSIMVHMLYSVHALIIWLIYLLVLLCDIIRPILFLYSKVWAKSWPRYPDIRYIRKNWAIEVRLFVQCTIMFRGISILYYYIRDHSFSNVGHAFIGTAENAKVRLVAMYIIRSLRTDDFFILFTNTRGQYCS